MNAPAQTIADAVAPLEAIAADAQKTVTAQVEKMTKSFEGVASFNQESLDAVIKVANVAMKSAEEINAEMLAFSKKSMEESVAAAKEIAAAKTVLELIERQTDFAKTAFDGMFKQINRMNELTLAASKEAMEPLTARAAAAAEMVKSQAA